MSKFINILSHFPKDIIGSFLESTPISIGLIHQTHRVKTTKGIFSLQKLHPKLATDGILADYKAVLAHLGQRQFPAPTLCQTKQGNNAWDDEEGDRWRLTTWIAGASYGKIKTTGMAYSAAAMLGQFHRVMAPIDYTFQSTHPLHDTPHHLRSLQEAVKVHQNEPCLDTINEMVDGVEKLLPKLMLPADIPQHVVHGDPKISNILFDEKNEAIGMIDLDTCARHSVLVDLGDAVRSWCQMDTEDENKPFSIERFQAIIEGYASTGPALQPAELALLPQAGRHITLELTARFLTDVLEDKYFAWDANLYTSRRKHNIARSQNMWNLAKQMEEASPTLEMIVNQTFGH